MANMGDYADMDAENEESAEVVCPRCGSRHVAQILHGMPAFTEELQRELAEGKVVLGGCDIDIFHPTPSCHCNEGQLVRGCGTAANANLPKSLLCKKGRWELCFDSSCAEKIAQVPQTSLL